MRFQALQSFHLRRGKASIGHFVAVRNEKVRGSNPLSSTKFTGPSDLRKRVWWSSLRLVNFSLLRTPTRTPADLLAGCEKA